MVEYSFGIVGDGVDIVDEEVGTCGEIMRSGEDVGCMTGLELGACRDVNLFRHSGKVARHGTAVSVGEVHVEHIEKDSILGLDA